MENVIVDNKYHNAKYLKASDPLYPCNAAEEKYKETCYLMQTSYMLTVVNGDFNRVFDLCASAEESHRNTCYQSLGRDASGRSTSNVAQTVAWCNLGRDSSQRENCVTGAVKDFISYFHSDTQAKELCAAFDDPEVKDTCSRAGEAYYKIF